MARRRRMRECSANTQHAASNSGTDAPLTFTQYSSSVLQRRPKVQLAYQLQGCVTEAASTPTLHSERLIEG